VCLNPSGQAHNPCSTVLICKQKGDEKRIEKAKLGLFSFLQNYNKLDLGFS
jgi:hypothetical protein